MILHLIKKDVLHKIIDFRFLVSAIMALFLVVLTTSILSEQYKKQAATYDEFTTSDRKGFENVKCFSELRLNAHMPPNPLWIFNKGVMSRVDRSVEIRHHQVPRQGMETASENPFMNIFQFFDLTAIFQILFSLLAILMVYDAVSGERAAGTLRALMANRIGRYQILVSKVASGMIVITIPLLLSMAVSLIIMTFVYGITFSGEQWIRIGLVLLVTLLYLGIFLSAGILVSSLVRHPSVSLIWLLFLWVIAGILQPQMGGYLAMTFSSVPPRETVESAESQVWEGLTKQAEEINEKIIEEVPGGAWHSDHSDNWPFYRCFDGNTVGLYRYVLRTQRIQPLFIEYGEKAFQVYMGEYHTRLAGQEKLQKLFDTFSPGAVCERMTAVLCGTAIENHDDFLDQARQYRRDYLSYLDDKKIFSDNANLWFTRQTMEQILNSDYEQRTAAYEKTGKFVDLGRDACGPLDLSGLPQFTCRPVSLGRSILQTALDGLILAVLCAVLLYLGSVAFNRYDIRSE